MMPFCHLLDSDITALAKDKAYAQIRLDEISIHQVISKFCFHVQLRDHAIVQTFLSMPQALENLHGLPYGKGLKIIGEHSIY